MRALFAIVDRSARTEDLGAAGSLAKELRRFGPRVAKHLSDLVYSIMKDEIDVDLTWRTPRGRNQQASLPAKAFCEDHPGCDQAKRSRFEQCRAHWSPDHDQHDEEG